MMVFFVFYPQMSQMDTDNFFNGFATESTEIHGKDIRSAFFREFRG